MYTFALLAAAVAVSASPIELRSPSLALRYVSNVTNVQALVASGQNKLAQVNSIDFSIGGSLGLGLGLGINLEKRQSSGSIINEDVTYVAPVTIGGNTWQLIVDTGSSNIWCGSRKSCEPTSTSSSEGGTVSVGYGSGSFSGNEYYDQVSFAGLTVNKQSLGSATKSSGFTTVDGIIGFGPQILTQGTVSNVNTVPTFMDNLYSQKTISTEVLGVYFKPESGSDTNDNNGELTLGGVDSSKYTGALTYFPKATSGQAQYYWGLNIASVTYSGAPLTNGAFQGIVDTGTTLIYIPQGAYNNFLQATGGTTDSTSHLASFTKQPTGNFVFNIGSTSYTLTPAQYLVPAAQYANFGLNSQKYYAWINNGGTSSVNCIIGQKFLENYYSVYDTTNSRIGFATRS